MKESDTSARFGGEEFIILLPETKLDQAVTVAERIRKTLATREWKQKDSGITLGTITLSLGVSQYRENEPETSLINRADKALYQAKSEGRNRVVVFQ